MNHQDRREFLARFFYEQWRLREPGLLTWDTEEADGRRRREFYARADEALAGMAAMGFRFPDEVKRARRTYPKCKDPQCGHSLRSHNELGYCEVGAGTPRACLCTVYDDGLRRQPDGSLA